MERVSLRFRLHDGTDVGPMEMPLTASVADVKEAVLAAWPTVRNVGKSDLQLSTVERFAQARRQTPDATATAPSCFPYYHMRPTAEFLLAPLLATVGEARARRCRGPEVDTGRASVG